jgi:recombination DNA repair RAD52 pathway protein
MSKFQSFAEKSKSKSINGSKIIDQNESIKSKDKSMSKSYNKGSEPEG